MLELGSTLPTLFLTFLLAILSDRENLDQGISYKKNEGYKKKWVNAWIK